MSTDPFAEIEKFSSLIRDAMEDHRGAKYPTHLLECARRDLARDVRTGAYTARKEVERLEGEVQVRTLTREVIEVGEVSNRPVDDLAAEEVLTDWLNHVHNATYRGLQAQLRQAQALHRLWQELAQIPDTYLGLGEYDWAFN